MKKQLMVLFTLLVILAGCSENRGKTNTISVSDVSDRERAILHMNTDHAFMFDFNVNGEFNEAMVWVEKYEKGILADDLVSSLSAPVDHNGMIVFSIQRPISEFDKTIVNVSISNDEGSSSGQNLDIQPENFDEMSSTYSTFDGTAKFVGDELTNFDLVYVLKSQFKK